MGKTAATASFILLFALLHSQRRIDYLELGRYELSESHFPKAIEHLNIYIKTQPYMYEGFFFRGYAKYQLDDYLGAEMDYTQAIALYPFLPDIYNYRAIVRDRLSNYTGALEDFGKSLSIDSSDAATYINRAITYLDLRKYKASVEDCNKAEQLKSKDDNLDVIRGTAYSESGHFKEGIYYFTLALAKNTNNSHSYVQRGVAWGALGQKDSALADFNYALRLDSVNAFALFQRALVELTDSDEAAGLSDLNKVIRLSPDCASAYFNRALLKANKGDNYGALNDYAMVEQLNPGNILVYYNRAVLKEKMNDIAGALKDYDRAIELYPDFADAYLNRAQIKQGMNNAKGAIADEKKGNRIKQMKYSEDDSLKLKDEIKLMKVMTMSDDFNTKDFFKEKVQYTPVNIQLQPVFYMVAFPEAGKRYRIYEVPRNKYAGDHTIALSNKTDSVDTKKIQAKIAVLDTLISSDPRNAAGYLDRAILYSSLSLYNESFTDYARSLAFDSTNALTYFSRANTRYAFLELLHSFDNNDNNTQATFNGQSAADVTTTVYREHTYEMVLKDYSRALILDPNLTCAWYNRANVKAKLKDISGAIKDVSKALVCDSTLADAYYNKGLLQILQHDNTAACLNLSKSGELGILESYYVMKKYCYK